jgi:hypothetical protein
MAWESSAPVDLTNYPPIPHMEGPLVMQNGRVLYYDNREGAYYDRRTDMYLTVEEYMETFTFSNRG